MQRWQGAALALVLCSGCVDPLVEDTPGYSRFVLPQGSAVPSLYDDPVSSGKLAAANKTAAFDPKPGALAPASGFANGESVRYWELGNLARLTAINAYQLVRCVPEGPPQPVEHALIVDSVPGDSDYSPFRLLQWLCVTAKYQNQIIPSFDAVDDAIALGLVEQPRSSDPPTYLNQPVLPTGVTVGSAGPAGTGTSYYRGKAIIHAAFDTQEGSFVAAQPMTAGAAFNVPTATVYHLQLPGQTRTARVVFSKPFADPMNAGARNPAYSPAWAVSTVEIKAKDRILETDPPEYRATLCANDPMATLMSITKESDLFTMVERMNVNNPCIARITSSTTRVNRPFLVTEVP